MATRLSSPAAVKSGLRQASAWLCCAAIVLALATDKVAEGADPDPRLKVTVSSYQPDQGNEPEKAVDGDETTFWHSAWNPHAPLPQSITVDRGTLGTIACLTYLPRQSGGSNGNITTYNLYVSTDGSEFTKVINSGKWASSDARKFANFSAQNARYIRLEAVAGVGNFANAAEITLSATPILYQPQQVTVLSPPYCSDIQGDTAINIVAPRLTSAMVKCWKQGPGFGADSTVAELTLAADGKATFVFPADDYPHGPLSVRISGTNEKVTDNHYLQLYNTGGVSWQEGAPEGPPPPAEGMELIFADDFEGELSISREGKGTTYSSHKIGWGDFSGIPFGDHENKETTPFAQRDTYLRIRADEAKNTTGLIASIGQDGKGITAIAPCYFECRFIAQSAEGTWPAFWVMTNEVIAEGENPGVDELDVIEAYGGEGPGNPNAPDSYRVVSHNWNQQGEQPSVNKAVHMTELEGGNRSNWFEAPHTYGVRVGKQDTVYYCDNIEVARHKTSRLSRVQPLYFYINLAIGGSSGWSKDLSPYGGIADMYVDYVRVWADR